MDAPLFADDFKEFQLRGGLPWLSTSHRRTSIDGVEFDACATRAASLPIDDVSIPVISLEDLKTN